MITATLESIGATTKITTYIDGIALGNSTGGSAAMSTYLNNQNLYIGSYNIDGISSLFYEGDLDNFSIFNKIISHDEIDFLYNSGEGTETLYEFDGTVTNNNFFATIGDYDTRSTFPENASKLLFSNIRSDSILRTANNQFNHVMVSGVPLSVSSCLFNNQTTKFRHNNSRDFPDLNYFYALDVIATNNVSHQTLTNAERLTRFNDTLLYINRWNALNYLNTSEVNPSSTPTNTTNLFGSTIGLGKYGELIFNKTAYTIDNVKEFKEVAFMTNLVSVGRIGNKYYLLITVE